MFLTRCRKLGGLCGRSLVWIINGLLLLTALSLGILLWFLNQKTSFPLPEWGLKKLNTALSETGLNLEAASISMDTSGWILVTDATLSNSSSGDPVARCPALLVKVNINLLKRGVVDISSVEGISLSLIRPAYLTGQKGDDTLLQRLSFRASKSGEWWQLHGLQVQTLGANVNASGALGFLNLSGDPTSTKPLRNSIADGFATLVQTMEQVRPWAAMAERPVVNLTVVQTDVFERHVQLSASCQAYHWQGNTLSELELATAFTARNYSIETLPVAIRASGLVIGEQAEVGAITCSLPDVLPFIKDRSLPSNLTVALGPVKAKGESIPGATLEMALDELPTAGATIVTRYRGLPLTLDGMVNPSEKTASLNLTTSILLTTITERPELQSVPVENWFKTERPLLVTASATLAPGWKPESAAFDITAEYPQLTGVPFTEMRFRGHTDFTQIYIDQADAVRPDYEVHGSLFQDFKTKDFRFLLKGNVLPEHLNPLIDDWWDKLWTYLHFTKPSVYADLDYNGRWGSLGVGMVFVGVNGSDFSVYSLPLERCRLLVWRQLGFVAIQRLVAKHALGDVSGQLSFIYPHLTGNDTIQTQLDIKTNVPLLEISKVVPELEEILPWFEMQTAPRLHTTGTLVDLKNKTIRRDLHIDATVPGDFSFMTLPLSELSLNAHLLDDTIRISPIRAVFVNGKVEGALFVHAYDDAHKRKLELSIEGNNVDYETGWAQLKRVLGEPEKQPVPAPVILTATVEPVKQEPPAPEPTALGKLDLSAVLEGYFGDPGSFVGRGQLAIYDAQLKRVRLLGPLSRLFEVFGISITTLDLRQAVTAFELTREQITLPNLVVSGPNAQIKANGHLQRASEELAFDVNVFFLKTEDSSLKNLVGKLFSPLSYVLALKLRGTLDDPNWRLALDPRNLFGSGTTSSVEPPSE
ncbi:MAG: hypothetical protein SFY80_06305 [Verrucomicrobiota bacterium]|nr:hypothetical protein [Verrucomicrobiota bacterium]